MYSRIFANAACRRAQLAAGCIAERKSVLDFLQDDIRASRARLSAGDKARLDAHLTGIRAIEQQLTTRDGRLHAAGRADALDPEDMANFPTIGKLQMDLMLLAHTLRHDERLDVHVRQRRQLAVLPVGSASNEEHHGTSHCRRRATPRTSRSS